MTSRHLALATATAFLLAGCSGAAGDHHTAATSTASQTTTTPSSTAASSMAMEHPMDGGPAPLA